MRRHPPSRVASGPEPVVVEQVGAALLLRTGADPSVALATMTTALAIEPGRVTVVTAPSVTLRPDLLDVVADVVDKRLQGTRAGIRLVTIGSSRPLSAIESDLRLLADRIDREVVGPLGPLTVASDGTVAVAAHRGARGGWMICAPTGAIRYESAWSPLPAWGTRLPTKIASRSSLGMATVHPVPAGLWILPDGLRPGRVGVAACVPPDPTTLTVFIGGCGEPPLIFADVLESLDALPLPERARIVLLPGAMPPEHAVAQLRGWRGGSLPVVVAVPSCSSDGAWSLAPINATGGLTWRPPVELPAEWRTVRQHRSRPEHSLRQEPTVPQRRLAGRQEPTGTRTPAGWSFVTGAAHIGVVPATAGFVVEVTIASTGFVMEGRPIGSANLAELIEACCQPRSAPLVIVGHAAASAVALDADALFAPLAKALGTTVLAADSDVSMSATGVLYTSGAFRAWHPIPGPADLGKPTGRSRVLGDMLPSSARPQRPSPHDSVDGAVADTRPAAASTAAVLHRSTPRSTSGPQGTTMTGSGGEDEAHLRQILNGRYDVYARAVARGLSEENAPQGGDPFAGTVTGLVAVHAYCATERDDVNRVLRESDGPNQDTPAAVVARYALLGLRRLPVVFGPVFAACATDVRLDAYLDGGELIEPGFVDADLSTTNHLDSSIEYVIWSVSARRVGPVAHGERATAIFAPGSRFATLDVDVDANPPRVFLLDLAAHRDAWSASTESLVHRLAMAASESVHRRYGPVPARRLPIGLDDYGHPFLAALRPSGLTAVSRN